jgi:pimeloyl-ACP methyl ester carboxylesterase
MDMARALSLRFSSAVVMVAVLLSFAALAAAGDARDARPGVRTVVLVHGAWADGSSWSKVIPLLKAAGFQVVAVQLPLTSLADDVATVKRALARVDGPLLLVAHSYGGVVITEAGNDPKVAGLLYVAAFAPQEGQSAFDLATSAPTPVLQELQADPDSFLTITPLGIRRDFAPDLSMVEQSVLTATQSPTAGAASLSAPITSAAWRNVPCWFVIATGDRVVSPSLQVGFARQMNAKTLMLSSGHVAMLSHPAAVATFISRAARDLR